MNIIRYVLLAATLVVCTAVMGQKSITQRTYWIDGDIGNVQTVTPTVDLTGIAPGIHSFSMRVEDSDGIWSNLVTRYFFVPTTMTSATKISDRQCWLDGKIVNVKSLGTSPTAIDLGELNPGIHSLTMRVKDNSGIWSNPLTRYFIIPTITQARTKIVDQEYWFDGKIGERQSLGTSPTVISLDALNQGMHSLTMRIKDDAGNWSSPVTKYFIIPIIISKSTEITEREYWIDGNLATRSTLDASPATVELTDLGVGMHSLTVRAKDNTGTWSSPTTKFFAIANDLTIEEVTLTGYLYWIDDDVSNIKSGPLADGSNSITLDISNVEAGNHILSWCVCDSKGRWSTSISQPFESTYTGIGSLTIDITSPIDGIVYDIQGRRMGDTSTTPLKEMHLPKGIYIINGKKIMIR